MGKGMNGSLVIDDTYIDYITFGKGSRNLIIIPGLSIQGVKGTARAMSRMFRIFSDDYRVFMFDRRNTVTEGFSNWDIAKDTARCMDMLGITEADVFGASQGGMIAQALAINYPEKVHGLVLAATLSRPNPTVRQTIGKWIEFAEKRDWKSLNHDTFVMLYTDEYIAKYKMVLPLLETMFKPSDPERFITLARACISFDAYDKLDMIKCPVLVLGADNDKVVTGDASREIAERLGCDIHMYEHYGHAVYDEAPDFRQRIFNFLQSI